MPPWEFWQRAKLRGKAQAASETVLKHMRFPKATLEEAQQAHTLLRIVFQDGFFAAIDNVVYEQALAKFLQTVHEKYPKDIDDDTMRRGDANLTLAFRLGYEKGREARP